MPQPFWKNPYIVLVLCTLMILISYGTRQSFGLFLIPISDAISNGKVEPFSFAVSLQTLVIGLSVPFVSMIADKWLGPIKILVIGGSLYALGMFLLSNASSELHLTLSVGVLSGLAASGCGLPMLLSVVGRVAPANQRSLWLGIVSAGGTGGQMFLVPLNSFLLERMDWTDAMVILAAFIFAIVPMALMVGHASGPALDSWTLGLNFMHGPLGVTLLSVVLAAAWPAWSRLSASRWRLAWLLTLGAMVHLALDLVPWIEPLLSGSSGARVDGNEYLRWKSILFSQ